MALNSSGYCTHQDIYDSVYAEFNDPSVISKVQPAVVKPWILNACQKITQLVQVVSERELLLISGQEDYEFNDSTLPVTGTGKLSTVGINVNGQVLAGTGMVTTAGTIITGVGTVFQTELKVGNLLIIGSEMKEIFEIHSNTELVVESAFLTTSTATAFTYSTTSFKRELVVGSVISVGANSGTIASVTDAKTATMKSFLPVDVVNQNFTVDTKVTEIPLKFHRITRIDRLENNIKRSTRVVEIEQLLLKRQSDWGIVYFTDFIPFLAAMDVNAAGKRILKVYKAPNVHKSVTLYGEIRVNAYAYASAKMTDLVPLSDLYAPAIRMYVKAWVYQVFGKDDKKYAFYMNEFAGEIRELNNNTYKRTVTEIVYR